MLKTIKKSLALLLVAVMVLGLMTVSAANESEAEPEPTPTGVPFSAFSGRVDELTGSEWTTVPHSSYSEDGLALRVTSGGGLVYAIVQGANRDTQNVFYISIDGVDGYTFMGRPNVSYVVANGWLYEVLNPMSAYRSEYALPASAVNANANPNVPGPVMTAMPEWFGADSDPDRDAARLERIGMEYHRTWTSLRFRLDQIGNPDPAAVSISWRGVGTAAGPAGQVARHLPTDTGELLAIGENTFVRYQPEGVYHPAEDFAVIFNPLRGGGANLQSSEPPIHTCADPENCPATWIHTTACRDTGDRIPFSESDRPLDGQFYGYAYVTWRSLEPEYGVFDWDMVRMYTKGDYPVVGPNMDQWQCVRGNLVSRALEEYARIGAYVQLRFVMDYPFGSPFGYWYGTNYKGGWYNNSPLGGQESHTDLAMINLRNETIADIPDWLIQRMRSEPNRPNAACDDNIPNRPDFDPGDGLFQRMRNPEDPAYRWFQRFRSTDENGNFLFHCAIPNPEGGADLRACADGCIPYRRPAGLTMNPPAAHAALGWNPHFYWGPEGIWYVSPPPEISGGVGMTPRYEHHVLIQYHERAVNALATEIAREGSVWNAVANVQLGSLGRWGEWHNWPTNTGGTFPNAELAHTFVNHYIEAFSSNENVQIGMRYPNWILSRYNFGQFNDQTGHTGNLAYVGGMTGQNLAGNDAASLANLGGWPGHGGGTGLGGNINANMGNVAGFTGLNGTQYTQAARNPTHWMHGWVGGEYGDQSSPSNWFWQYVQFDVGLMGDLHRGGMHDYGVGTGATRVHIMNTIQAFRWTHISNLAPRGPNAGRTNAATGDMQRAHKNNDAAYDNMGYRFTLEEVEVVGGSLQRGSSADVRMVVNNKGVAPFYRDWPFEVSFIDSNGNVAGRQIIEDIDIREWMPRHRPINNARPAPTTYRYTADGTRVYYRTFAELGAAGTVLIPANDGRTEVTFTVNVPSDLPNQDYTMAIAILDPILLRNNPGIQFHNLGSRDDMRLVLEPFVVEGVYHVSFRCSQGGVFPSSGLYHNWWTQVSWNGTVALPTEGMTRAGFTHVGWRTESGLTVTGEQTFAELVSNNQTVTNLTIHAAWAQDFTGTSPSQLNALLAAGDVNLRTPGSGGYGIAANNTLVIPEGRTLYVSTVLNVRRGGTLRVEGTLVVFEGGRMNNDGHPTSGGGTIEIAEDGRLINYGYVENISNSFIFNYGRITNNGTTGNFGRFEVRANTTFVGPGTVDGSRALNIHRDAIRTVPTP